MAMYPESARLTISLLDGRSATGICGVPRRMPDNPQSDAELIMKFEVAFAHAGHGGTIEARPGNNPAQTFALLIN